MRPRPRGVLPILQLALGAIVLLSGCRAMAPIHVWAPPPVNTPGDSKIALAPVAGSPELAKRIEQALLQQRPAASSDIALFTAEQLAERSPIRLVSTASLNSELTAIHAARAVGADILLQGEVLRADIDLSPPPPEPTQNVNMNQMFFMRKANKNLKNESLLLSWRVIDTESGVTLGAHSFTLHSADVVKQYPDLQFMEDDESAMLIAASARETWKTISPVVEKQEIRLAVPWLQLGAWRVRRGVRAAKKGQWSIAEEQWERAARIPFNASAHHNLALAKAAREDFAGAKQELQHATGPLAFRLPGDTLFWLDKNHRRYHEAHGLEKPPEGWAFPEPISIENLQSAQPIEISDLPWWTAIPLTKPPGWSWHDWLRQPFMR